MAWFYLSFADDVFLGAVVVEGDDVVTAVRHAWQLGINPGGEVMAIEDPDIDDHFPPDARNRLLSKTELLERFEGQRLGDLSPATLRAP